MVRSSLNRYITILYFLNEVDDGGETAFPMADNATLNKQVIINLYLTLPFMRDAYLVSFKSFATVVVVHDFLSCSFSSLSINLSPG